MKVRAPGADGDRPGGLGTGAGAHLGELRLRQLDIGELASDQAEQARQHLGSCEDCRARLEALGAEQRAFAQSIPFARFAGGVERAARVPRSTHRSRRAVMVGGGLALAAAAGLLLVAGGAPSGARLPGGDPRNRIKGGPAITATVRIGAAAGQRSAAPGSTTVLAAGERLRIGYALPEAAHLMVVTIDDAGEATKISTDAEAARLVPSASAVAYLPGSIELTGAGKERLYLFVSEFPLDPDSAADAARAAHAAARGDLTRAGLPTLPPRVRAFTWLFEKP
jgi:hypothetical protein